MTPVSRCPVRIIPSISTSPMPQTIRSRPIALTQPPARSQSSAHRLPRVPPLMQLSVARLTAGADSCSSPTSGALTAVPGSPFAAGTNPQAMAVFLGYFLFVANAGSDYVSVYPIDPNTGALGAPSTAGTAKSPTSIVIDPEGSQMYVANHGGSNDISEILGQTAVPGSPFPAGGNPLSLALWAGGKFLYPANPDATNPSISGFSVDAGIGVLSPLSGSPFPIPVSHYIATDQTGAYLYVTSGASVVGYGIDATTGALTALPGFPVAAGTNAYSITIDPTNRTLYVTNDGAANVSAFTLDASTGALTPMAGSPFPAGHHPQFIATF